MITIKTIYVRLLLCILPINSFAQTKDDVKLLDFFHKAIYNSKTTDSIKVRSVLYNKFESSNLTALIIKRGKYLKIISSADSLLNNEINSDTFFLLKTNNFITEISEKKKRLSKRFKTSRSNQIFEIEFRNRNYRFQTEKAYWLHWRFRYNKTLHF